MLFFEKLHKKRFKKEANLKYIRTWVLLATILAVITLRTNLCEV